MIIEQLCVTGMAVFCYIIGDEKTKECILIDPAGGFNSIFEKIEKHGLTVKYIINTHGHFDHTAGNDFIMNKTGASILIHENDIDMLGSISNKLLSRVIGGKGSPMEIKPLKHGDKIVIGDVSLTVIHTPGHTQGGICLYTPGNIFTGDTLFTDGTGRTDLPGGSDEEIMDSIRNRILSLPDDTIIWPGHNYGRTISSTVREQKPYYL